jgi:hypothetical protein
MNLPEPSPARSLWVCLSLKAFSERQRSVSLDQLSQKMPRRFEMTCIAACLALLGLCLFAPSSSAWILQSTQNPSSLGNKLLGVSCATPTSCIAVGDSRENPGPYKPLAEKWDGSSWTTQTVPLPGGSSSASLWGISCSASNACTAVGYSFAKSQITMAARWNGTSWSVQTTPNPEGAGSGIIGLWSVSCATSTSCMAVGEYTDSSGTRKILAERWDGTSWTITSTPIPAGAQLSSLQGVSCTSASACTAVGFYQDSLGVTKTLVERWNGTSWSIQESPSPSTTSSSLAGVFCTSSTACVAVGRTVDGAGVAGPLAEHWDGTTWSTKEISSPSGAKSAGLGKVSCFTGSSCVAVGSYTNSGGTGVTLAERWNGSSWAVQSTPNPGGATSSVLTGVSCSEEPCIGVGRSTISGTDTTLAEIYG